MRPFEFSARALVAGALGVSLLTSGCLAVGVSAIPPLVIPSRISAPDTALDTLSVVPSPEARIVGDIRGVVLRSEARGERFEFSDVAEVRWTSSAVTITGTLNAPGHQEHGRNTTASFPLADVQYLIVHEYLEKVSFASTLLATLAATFGAAVLGLLIEAR